ncbi:hypothetical protein EBR43_05530 [bacterium]|nr:hypothetical protein [bacterium]NBX72152.1 hypothetical protein [bacterium]
MLKEQDLNIPKFFLATSNYFLVVLFSFYTPFILAFDWQKIPPPQHFPAAKELLLVLYQENPETFYCGCAFNKKGQINKDQCRVSLNLPNDMFTLEWEHIVPASLLGADLECWQTSTCSIKQAKTHRDCCQKTSKQFQLREANLYNLVPSIKYANRKRSNFKPGLIAHKEHAERVCGFLIDKRQRIMEPDDSLKGFIARTYLRLNEIYQFKLSPADRKLYYQWAAAFPPTEWEIKRELIINKIYAVE